MVIIVITILLIIIIVKKLLSSSGLGLSFRRGRRGWLSSGGRHAAPQAFCTSLWMCVSSDTTSGSGSRLPVVIAAAHCFRLPPATACCKGSSCCAMGKDVHDTCVSYRASLVGLELRTRNVVVPYILNQKPGRVIAEVSRKHVCFSRCNNFQTQSPRFPNSNSTLDPKPHSLPQAPTW